MPMNDNIKGHIYGLIAEIAAAEKITKAKLGLLSRDLLMYVPETHDIEAVNRLISVLTPVNKRVAIAFFTAMLPWEVEKDNDGVFQRFGKKTKSEKKEQRTTKKIAEFLADVDNNIWTWAENNIEVEVKQKDFAGLITKTLAKALAGDEKSNTPPLDPALAMQAVLASGIDIETILNVITQVELETEEQQQAA